jgi:glycosyltransferase involved in cell wall biosynthesis
VVNSHWLVPQGFTSTLVKPFGRYLHVLHVHAADVYFLRRFPFGALIARYVVRSSDVIFADGSHVRDSLDELIGFKSDAILRPMGVWTDQFSGGQATSSPFPEGYVLFIGRLVEKKGVTYLLRAMTQVTARHAGVGLLVAGSGPLEEQLKRETGLLGLDSVVKFLGSRTHPEVVDLIRGSRVVCVPSIIDSKGETEGMPTVVVEAMAAGALVVGANVDGIPDVLRDHENGWLCEPADPDDLADKLLEALTGKDTDAVSENARKTAARHDWQQVGEEYLTAILEQRNSG